MDLGGGTLQCLDVEGTAQEIAHRQAQAGVDRLAANPRVDLPEAFQELGEGCQARHRGDALGLGPQQPQEQQGGQGAAD